MLLSAVNIATKFFVCEMLTFYMVAGDIMIGVQVGLYNRWAKPPSITTEMLNRNFRSVHSRSRIVLCSNFDHRDEQRAVGGRGDHTLDTPL